MNRKKIVVIGIFVAILFVWYLVDRNGSITLKNETANNNENFSTSTADNNIGETADFGGIKDEGLGFSLGGASTEKVQAPPPEVFGRNLTANDSTKSRIKILEGELKSEPNDLDNWIELGVLYKSAKDYEGAKLAWEYASLIRPKNTSSFINLGDLYHYYLKDFVKAESSLLKALNNDPKMTEIYMRLFDLYSVSYRVETTLAADILKKGIENNSSAVDLIITLGDYYKNKGAYPLARIEYEKALSIATKSNNKEQISEINSLIAKLPNE